MRLRAFAICLIIIFSGAEALAAASKYLIVQPKGFVEIEGFSQWVTLGYGYSGTTTDDSESTRHRFKEIYSLFTKGSIVDSRVAAFSLRTDLKLRQEKVQANSSVDGSKNTLDLTYQFNILAFDREIYPVRFSSFLQESLISDSYLQSYTLTASGNHLTSWYLNRIVPLRFDLSHGTSSTSGLARDSATTNTTFAMNASNNLGNRSYSEFNGSYSLETRDSSLGNTQTRSSTYSLTNNLLLDNQRKYSLSSGVSYNDSRQRGNPSTTLKLSEQLKAQFGAALKGEASYLFDSTKNTGFAGASQEVTTHTVQGRLQHRLFQSLDTTLESSFRESELLGGNENETTVLLRFDYRKKLPRNSLFNIDIGGEHQVTQRHLPLSRLDVPNEVHANVQQGGLIELRVPGSQVSVLSVKSLDPEILYQDQSDYLVNSALGTIEILLGGGIGDGTELHVAYSVELDNNIEYVLDAYALGSSLTLLDGKYKIKGRLTLRNPTILSGEPANGNWGETRTALLRGEAKGNYQRYVLEFFDYDGPSSKYRYLEGGWFFDRSFPGSSVHSLVKNRYTQYDADTANSKSYGVNSFMVGGGYQRLVSTLGTFQLSADYVNTNGDLIANQRIYFRVGLQGRINKLIFNLVGSTLFRISDSRTAREDSLILDVTRYF